MKLFLIDAYAMIYRAYYAFVRTPRINSKGKNTSAVFGFVNSLEETLRKEQPTHIAVAFDPSGQTFRHEAYEQYKAQREETPEDIRWSVPIIKDIIRAYRIPILEVPRYEADDVIATAARRAEAEGYDVFMMTPDKDYGQLVTDHSFIYRPRHGGGYETMGTAEVLAKYDIANVSQVIDLLGLMGDASDNIPGCPGVGEKTAAKLLKEFGSVENLLEHTADLKGALKAKVEENAEQIRFSKFLATIVTDVPMDFNPADCVVREPDTEALTKLFAELEFRSFITRLQEKKEPKKPVQGDLFTQGNLFAGFELPEVKPAATDNASDFDTIETTPHTYHVAETAEEQEALAAMLAEHSSVTFDTETDGLDHIEALLVGMSFAVKEGEAWYVPVPADMTKAQTVVNRFAPILQDERIEKTGQNLKFDILILRKYGVRVGGKLFDTMIAHYLVNPEARHGMDYLAETYLHYKTVHIDELIGAKGKNQLSMRQVPLARIAEYAAEDADVTLRLRNVLAPELKRLEAEQLFHDMEMPLIYVLADMEATGVRLDTAALAQSSEILTSQLLALESEIYSLAGTQFNINSPKQVGEILFDRLHLDDKAKKTKNGAYSTGEEIIEKLRSRHPIAGKLLEYRGIKKLLSTYIDALPQLISTRDGKIHTSYNQAVTSTGRLSSTNPNLQNIPVREEMGREIRKAFIPDDGCTFFSADYSQIELRLMAHLSEDANMIAAFRSGADIHAATAAKIYGVPIDEVTKDMRRKAKTANFGIIYGISVFGLAERLAIPRSEAKELIDGYFASYPRVRKYMEASVEVAREHGYVETIYRRRRYLPDISSHNAVVRGYAERNAINAPIQGSAADIIKMAMIRIHRRFAEAGLRSRMILQVHDELNFNVPKEELETVRNIVLTEMENVLPLRVPLIADSSDGHNWLEAH
jgi:DNA polymerase-1